MKQLLESDDPDRGLACQIVIGAGSRNWTPELAKLQLRDGFDNDQASKALATVLRNDALPYLREALERFPGNASARYGIKELESRATTPTP